MPRCILRFLFLCLFAFPQRLFLVPFLSRRFCLLKHRISRVYVHPTLDEQLQRQRMQQEVRAMLRCLRAGVDVPHLLAVEEVAYSPVLGVPEETQQKRLLGDFLGGPLEAREGGGRILMEWVEGCTVKAFLDFLYEKKEENCTEEERDACVAGAWSELLTHLKREVCVFSSSGTNSKNSNNNKSKRQQSIFCACVTASFCCCCCCCFCCCCFWCSSGFRAWGMPGAHA